MWRKEDNKMFKKINLLFIAMSLVSCVPFAKKANSKLDFRTPSSIVEKVSLTEYNSDVQMGSRSYIESVLLQVFDAENNKDMASYIQSNIFERIEFGGACDKYSASDEGVSTKVEFERERCKNSIGVVQPSNNNPMRYSLTTKACEKLVGDANSLNAVRNKIFSDKKWGNPTNEKILLAWHLFNQASDTDTDVISALKDIEKVTSSNDEAWKIIILTLCISPEWQVL